MSESTLGGLGRDVEKIATVELPRELKKTMRQAAITGNTVAKDNARRTSGRHGKWYPRAFTWETSTFAGFGGGSYQAEYGPEVGRLQGSMSFEHGSRNQPPHNDLAKSADLMGPALSREVGDAVDRVFW